MKNQWGWGGYTTCDLERCHLSARAVALIYNWWSWYVRLAHPKARREAITSRPLLLSGIARIRKGLDHIRATAPQLPKAERWRALIRYIIAQILAARPTQQPPPLALTWLLPAAQSG